MSVLKGYENTMGKDRVPFEDGVDLVALFPRPNPIENPGTWDANRIRGLFGIVGDKIPSEMKDERMYRGVKVELRSANDKRRVMRPTDPRAHTVIYEGDGLSQTLHRIVVHCPCGKVVGFGRMEQHAKVCDDARATLVDPKDLCNCAVCVREQRELDRDDCPNHCARCGTFILEDDKGWYSPRQQEGYHHGWAADDPRRQHCEFQEKDADGKWQRKIRAKHVSRGAK